MSMTTLWILRPSRRWLGCDGLALVVADTTIAAENTLRQHEGQQYARLFARDDTEFGDLPTQRQWWIVSDQLAVDDQHRGFVTFSYWTGKAPQVTG